jgi:hypothetical protein
MVQALDLAIRLQTDTPLYIGICVYQLILSLSTVKNWSFYERRWGRCLNTICGNAV